jgi:nickel-type superoxide dismutase maturation protease
MSMERGRHRPLSSFAVRGLALGASLAAVATARRWFDVVEVQGSSMAPTLVPGEWLLIERRTYARRPPRVGEIVLAADPREPTRELIKRVASVDGTAGNLDLRGDAPDASTDSRTFGAIPMSAVRWRVVARYWPVTKSGRL